MNKEDLELDARDVAPSKNYNVIIFKNVMSRITHATPAAAYAATAYRDWECDTVSPKDAPDTFKVTKALVLSHKAPW